jgi:ribosome-binding factor A
MPSYRVQRTNEDVMREIAALLREMKDPRVQDAMLSVVKTDLAGDLSTCKVYVSSLKGEQECKDAVAALKNAAGFLRHELGQRVKMRHAPELRFIADSSIARSAEISQILNSLHTEGDDHED